MKWLRAVLWTVGILWAVEARAEGLNLSWDDCGTAGVELHSFACDVNDGVSVLVGSVVAGDSLTAVTKVDAYLDFRFSDFSVPDWWQVRNAGSCRETSVTASGLADGITSCVDHWQGRATVFVAYFLPSGGSGERRLAIGAAVSTANAELWPEGTEVFVFKLRIDHLKTVGPGACTGCERGVDISFVQATMTNAGSTANVAVLGPADRNVVKWNGGFTPALNTSWGAIKALYR